MPAGQLVLHIDQGRPFDLWVTFSVRGVPQQLSGVWTPVAQIRDVAGGTLLLDLTGMFTVDDGRRGRMHLHVPGSATRTLLRSGEWELVLVPTVGGVDESVPLLRGPVMLHPTVVQL